MIDPLNLTDEQLESEWHAARHAAERAIRDSRHAEPETWSERAQKSNRRVAEFMVLDAERHAREAIRIAAPVDLIESEGLDPKADPLPYWIFWLVLLLGVAVLLLLWGKTE
jgi:hypothetical protein